MQQAQINAYRFATFWQWLMCHFTSKHHIPGIALTLDATGFDRSPELAMELHFDGADFRETHPMIGSKRVPTLRIAEAIIAVLALKAWVASFLTIGAPSEEGIKGFLHPSEHIL